ncbi:MAG: hypothetical protein IE887_05835 [Campylobacterales bacterium]|nr:hypothetical protein [Campylobacterales bacterium]
MSVELSQENILELKKLSKTIKFLYVEDSFLIRFILPTTATLCNYYSFSSTITL